MKKWESIPKDILVEKISKAKNFKEALESIGYSTYSTNNKIIKEISEKYSIDISHFNASTANDLKGQRFGKLEVLERDYDYKKNSKRAYWRCKCDCGNIKTIMSTSLVSGKTLSCGCFQKEKTSNALKENLIGQKFGKLEVIKAVDNIIEASGQQRTAWLCQCDCGNQKIVKTINLKNGSTTSCGCIYSKGEYLIEQILKQNNIQYIKEYKFSDLKTKNNYPMRFDFAIFKNQNLIALIEYQGRQHYEEGEFKNAISLSERQERDTQKREYCLLNRIKLIEIPYWDYSKINFNYIKERLDERIY